MQLINIFHIICVVLTSKIVDPNLTYYEESLQQSNFSAKVRQKKTITYWNNTGIFGLSLIEVDENKQKIEKNLNDLDYKEDGLYQLEGCYSKQRSIMINYNLQLRLESLIPSLGIFFTDIATAANKLKAYIIRNDYQIFQINISNGLGEIFLLPDSLNFSNYLNQTEEKDQFYLSHPYLIDDEGSNKIYAVTELGGISFLTNTTISKAQVISENFQQRKQIYNVHKNSKAQIIIIACGVEGIDIYDISNNGIVQHQKQLLPEDLDIPGGVIIDVDSNDDETKLYLLDQESGLIIYDISDLNNIQKILAINLPKTKSFDHYKDTIFIVAKTNTQLDYAAEIFLDLEHKTYYYNSLYIDEMVINGVNVFDKYAVLIGEDGHKIIYHSIYNGFLDISLQQHTNFQEDDLFKIKEYDFSKQYVSHNRIFVGIAKYQFKYIQISFEEPKIICSSSNSQQHKYFVSLNSSVCDTKSKAQDTSLFSMCKISHEFVFEAESKPGNKKTYVNYTILMYSLIVGSIWIIILISYLYKKWGYKLEFLKWRKQKLIASQPFNIEQELSNQN